MCARRLRIKIKRMALIGARTRKYGRMTKLHVSFHTGKHSEISQQPYILWQSHLCLAQDGEFSTAFIMLAYLMHSLWSQYLIVKYPPSPCYTCLLFCLFVCCVFVCLLFVCLFVCLQGGLIAVLTALSYHDKFTGLILSSPATYGEIGTITVSQIMIVRQNSHVQWCSSKCQICEFSAIVLLCVHVHYQFMLSYILVMCRK